MSASTKGVFRSSRNYNYRLRMAGALRGVFTIPFLADGEESGKGIAQERGGKFVVASGNVPVAFEPVEEAITE